MSKLTKTQRVAKLRQIDAWRNEIEALLAQDNWTMVQADRVDELASLLEFSEEDRYWQI